jgi:hypothetical protein
MHDWFVGRRAAQPQADRVVVFSLVTRNRETLVNQAGHKAYEGFRLTEETVTCNSCEKGFQGAQSIVVSIVKNGSTALVYVQNQGRNIVLMRRILLCAAQGTGSTVLYLRPPPDLISWTYPSAYLEPGLTALYYQWTNVSHGSIVQAQAEYTEIDGRSRSCAETF